MGRTCKHTQELQAYMIIWFNYLIQKYQQMHNARRLGIYMAA